MYAFQEAERRDARLSVLHASTRRHLTPELPSLVPATSLGNATRNASVVVIGAHRRTGRLGHHLGPVAHTLLHRSHCPVVLVPTAA